MSDALSRAAPPHAPGSDMGDVLASIRRMIAHEETGPLPPQATLAADGVLRLDAAVAVNALPEVRKAAASQARAEALQWALSADEPAPGDRSEAALPPTPEAAAPVPGEQQSQLSVILPTRDAAVEAPAASQDARKESSPMADQSIVIEHPASHPQPAAIVQAPLQVVEAPPASVTVTPSPAAPSPGDGANDSPPSFLATIIRDVVRQELSGDARMVRDLRDMILGEVARVIVAPPAGGSRPA